LVMLKEGQKVWLGTGYSQVESVMCCMMQQVQVAGVKSSFVVGW